MGIFFLMTQVGTKYFISQTLAKHSLHPTKSVSIYIYFLIYHFDGNLCLARNSFDAFRTQLRKERGSFDLRLSVPEWGLDLTHWAQRCGFAA